MSYRQRRRFLIHFALILARRLLRFFLALRSVAVSLPSLGFFSLSMKYPGGGVSRCLGVLMWNSSPHCAMTVWVFFFLLPTTMSTVSPPP